MSLVIEYPNHSNLLAQSSLTTSKCSADHIFSDRVSKSLIFVGAILLGDERDEGDVENVRRSSARGQGAPTGNDHVLTGLEGRKREKDEFIRPTPTGPTLN